MDELSRKRLVIGALAAIENLKTILAQRGNWAFDIRIRLLEMEKNLERADSSDPETEKLLEKFYLLHQEILEGKVPQKDG